MYLAFAIIQPPDTCVGTVPRQDEADTRLGTSLLLDSSVDRQLVVVGVCGKVVLQRHRSPLHIAQLYNVQDTGRDGHIIKANVTL